MIQVAAGCLMILGIYQLLTTKHMIKMLIGLNLFELGLNLLIITIGFREGGLAPILTSDQATSALKFVDPLPQAIVLTAIVIGLGVTAVGLTLAKKLYAKHGTYELDQIGGFLS